MPLIGREAEQAAVTALLTRARDGCAVLRVVAEPGLGKSALLDEAADQARAAGFVVARCAGAEAEAGMAYAGLTDLLEPIVAGVGDRLPAPQRAALDVVAMRAEPGPDGVEPQLVARAALSAVSEVRRRRPVLLVVDDAHWLDAETRRVLAFVLRRAAELPLALVVARRDEPADELDLALRSLPDAAVCSLGLTALTPEQVEQLLLARGIALPRATLRRIQNLAGGNPLYAIELAAMARSDPEASPRLPPSLDALVRERIARLPAEAASAVRAAAQLSSADPDLVAVALGATAPETRHALDLALGAAVDAHVLVEQDGTLRFGHPLLAEAASATAGAAFRRQVHRRLADVVTDVEARALHLSQAYTEPDDELAAAIEAGATRARARAAPEVAAELLAAAVRLTPATSEEARRRRRVDCAYHWVAAGKVRDGLHLLDDAIADQPAGEQLADLEWRSAMLHFLSGDIATCVAQLEAAAEHTHDARLREELRTRQASMRSWLGDFRATAELSATIDVDLLRGGQRINALANLATARFVLGEPVTPDPDEIVAHFEALRPPLPPHEHPISRLAPVLLASRPVADVLPIAQRPYAAARQAEDDIGTAWNGAMCARALVHAGRWPEAAEVAGTALQAARRADSPPPLAFALAAGAAVAALRGDVATAESLAEESIALAAGQALLWCGEQGRLVLGFLALSRGDGAAAAQEFTAVVDALDARGQVEPTVPVFRWFHVAALLEAGDVAQAERRIDALEHFAAARGHALAAAVAATGRGTIAALRGDRDAADAAFAAALAAHDRVGWPFERAVSVLAQGRAYRLQQRRSLARAALTAAADAFAELGAPLWETQARAELAGVSGRAPAAPDALTDTERRVAELAAAGRTNQEIAEQLFISAKTVATHLTHTYAKLGVRSRTELAHRMG